MQDFYDKTVKLPDMVKIYDNNGNASVDRNGNGAFDCCGNGKFDFNSNGDIKRGERR